MNSRKIMFAFIGVTLLSGMVSFKSRDKHTLYDFKAKTIDGKNFSFASLKGKKVLIVNTASLCGYTPQYADLEKLYLHFKDSNFTIIGFPANNFGHQEPGSNDSIKVFCSSKYNVSFQMMEKISVKGDDIDPLYKWLTEKSENGVQDAEVKWNFQKFMIDEQGNWAGVALSKELPTSDRIENWIRGKKD